jgi:hypothetical protein
LLLQVVGSNNYVNSIQTALGILNTTQRGSEIIQALEVSPRIYVISNGDPGHINTTDGRLKNICVRTTEFVMRISELVAGAQRTAILTLPFMLATAPVPAADLPAASNIPVLEKTLSGCA